MAKLDNARSYGILPIRYDGVQEQERSIGPLCEPNGRHPHLQRGREREADDRGTTSTGLGEPGHLDRRR